VAETDEWARRAVSEKRYLHHAPTAEPRKKARRQHHRQHRPEWCTQECEPESTVSQTELLFDMRDVRDPGRKEHAVNEEHGRYRSARLPDVSWTERRRDSSPHRFMRAVRRYQPVSGLRQPVGRRRRR
jgi:hypothetical protein